MPVPWPMRGLLPKPNTKPPKELEDQSLRATGRTTRIIARTLWQCVNQPGGVVLCEDHTHFQREHDFVAKAVSSLLTQLSVPHERRDCYIFLNNLPKIDRT